RPQFARNRSAPRLGRGPSPRGADRARLVSHRVGIVILAPDTAAPLARPQLPLWPYLPLWVAAAGSGLTAARLLLPADRLPSPRLRRWLLPVLALAVAIGVRWHYGYLLARDPCVAYLYVLVGIKYLEAKGARDGGVLVCLALFLTL